MRRNDTGGKQEHQDNSYCRNEQTCAQAAEVSGDDSSEPGKRGSPERGGGKEPTETGMVWRSREQEGDDERVKRADCGSVENCGGDNDCG